MSRLVDLAGLGRMSTTSRVKGSSKGMKTEPVTITPGHLFHLYSSGVAPDTEIKQLRSNLCLGSTVSSIADSTDQGPILAAYCPTALDGGDLCFRSAG